MNVSSRWCVTAMIALGAAACSDPVPPPAQGAFWAHVQSLSPPIADKACPVTDLAYDVPTVDTQLIPPETLDQDTYKHHLIDGQDGATVRCSVSGSSTFTFSGRVSLGGRALDIASGTLGANKMGTARITVTKTDQPGFSHSLTSPSANCTINAAAAADNKFQVKAGSIWASFSCASVEAAPTDACRSTGFFVFENCDQ